MKGQIMDPVTFSIIRHRLFRVVEEAVITLKHVSGSAITNEGHDLMVSLYQADGSLLMGGVGFLHHLTSAAEACKAIIRRFEGRIDEGDIFLLNDPYTAALAHLRHLSRLADPSRRQTGGVERVFCPRVRYRCDESRRLCARRAGHFHRRLFLARHQADRARRIASGRLGYDPQHGAQPGDGRARPAFDDCLQQRRGERMLALSTNTGRRPRSGLQELIDQSEAQLRDRLRELPDGRWQSRQYLEVKGEIYKVLLTMTKSGDALTFDFTGSSPQSKYSVNCSKWASLGGLFAPLFPLLCYDIVWNEGVIKPITMIAPEGTIVNCTRPAPVSVATVGAIQSVNNAACSTIGKMLAASEKYAGEATAVWHANHFAIFMFGNNQRGRLLSAF